MNISIEIKERDTDHIDIFVAGEIDAYTAPKVKEALEVYQVKEGYSTSNRFNRSKLYG